jgi:hypothetical protein
MGRGRAKAKQQKVARELKYSTPVTDLSALERELHANNRNGGGFAHYAAADDEVDDDEDDLDEQDVDADEDELETDPDDYGKWASGR